MLQLACGWGRCCRVDHRLYDDLIKDVDRTAYNQYHSNRRRGSSGVYVSVHCFERVLKLLSQWLVV
jgi:hypothetical protein